MLKRFKEFLLTWKPIHLCWWFEQRGLPVPKYFIGGGSAPPSVTTNAATNVAKITATGNGNVTSDGGDAITERGFVFSVKSVNSDPLIGGGGVTRIIVAGTTGAYSGTLTPLVNSTLYTYKAYAINSKGTSYGAATDFTTDSLVSTVLSSPADEATGVDILPVLDFTGTDPDSLDIRYQLQIDTTGLFDGVATSYDDTGLTNESFFGGDSSNTQVAVGHSFQIPTGITCLSIDYWLHKTNSPTDSLVIKVYSGSFGGTLLGTSDTVLGSSLSTSFGFINFNFSTPFALSSGTTYYIAVERTGARDTSNAYRTQLKNPGGYADGAAYRLGTGGVWTSQVWDHPFKVKGEVFTVVSGTDTGFVNPDVGGDTDPFSSGHNIQFTVQSGDELEGGSEYFWRVRGKDPTHSDTYGAWATTRSFLVGEPERRVFVTHT